MSDLLVLGDTLTRPLDFALFAEILFGVIEGGRWRHRHAGRTSTDRSAATEPLGAPVAIQAKSADGNGTD